MKNIICIELSKYNHQKINEISKLLNLNFSALIKCKELGDDKIWISPEGKLLVHTTKKNKSEIIFSDEHQKDLLDIKPTVKTKKSKSKELSIDSLLEKITDYGIMSLTDDEKEFLDKESNK
jgi:hypothetical protein